MVIVKWLQLETGTLANKPEKSIIPGHTSGTGQPYKPEKSIKQGHLSGQPNKIKKVNQENQTDT